MSTYAPVTLSLSLQGHRLMEVCYSLHRRETIVAVKGMTMSRFIKSAETLKARAGKQVKVDGEIFNVSYEDETIKFDNGKRSFNVVDDPVCIGRFLRSHNVASAGYKFKHTSSSKFILNKECRITLKPFVGDFEGEASKEHTVVGMIRFCKDTCGDKGYMLLTNDEHLRGDPAADKKGYDWSWWLGSDEESMEADVERTEPLEECSCVAQKEFTDDLSNLPLNKPVKVQFKLYPGETYEGMFKRCHKTEDGNERIFFLSDHNCFDGCGCWTDEREGYKYSWSMASSKLSDKTSYEYKIVGDAEAPKKVPLEKLEEKEYSLCHDMGDESSRKTVKGVIKEYKGISYLLSNDEDFDGGHPDAVKGTEYAYGWWLCEGSDISKSGYAIREACAESAKTSDDFIIDKECLVTIKPETGDWRDEVHTVTGMLVKERGDWYLLSNEKALDGSAPGDTKDYKYGWFIDSDLKSQHKVLGTAFDHAVEEVKKDPLVRIAMALEDIATYLSRMSK